MGVAVKTKGMLIEPVSEEDLWERPWSIQIIDQEGKKLPIGTISFAGEKQLGEIPVSVELNEKYRNQGYGTQALGLMVDWAFKYSNIYEIKAEAERENDKAIKMLEHNGFIYRSGDRKMEQFSIVKRKTGWLGLYMVIGFVAGIIIGLVIAHPAIGMAIGLLAGFAVGTSLDKTAQAKREAVTGKKENHRKRNSNSDRIEM